jgi:phosphate transport system permease protein
MKKREIRDALLRTVLLSMSGAALLIPLILLVWIAGRGWGVIDWTFLTSAESDFGSSGGILYQIFGSLILVLGAAGVAAPLGWALAVLRRIYLPAGKFRRFMDLTLYTLHGVPSIVFGLFGYLCFVHALGLGVSWSTGSLILALMILPTVSITVSEGLAALPREHKEAANALGLLPWQLIRSTLWPFSQPFLWTGLTLGLARAAGETAPIFFTAAVFSGVTLPRSIHEPVVTLPTHIMTLAQEASSPVALANAWGTALVLVGLVGLLSGFSWGIRKHALKGIGHV